MPARKRKRASIDWEKIRAEYECGATMRGLARRFKLSHTAIGKRADKEGWTQDLEQTIQRKMREKVAGTVATGNPEKRAQAVEEEAERRATVVLRHREQWNAARGRVDEGLRAHAQADAIKEDKKRLSAKSMAFKDMMAGKISAETLQIIQNGERKAWNITNDEANTLPPGVFQFVVIDDDEPEKD